MKQTSSDEERVEIIETALPYIDRQLDLVRRQKRELEKLESELVEKRKRGLRSLRELSR
jgi:prefoldin subunit 5